MTLPFFKKKEQNLADLEEQNEMLEVQEKNEDLELSIAQKQAMRKKLEEAGLTVKNDFMGSVQKAFKWFKEH